MRHAPQKVRHKQSGNRVIQICRVDGALDAFQMLRTVPRLRVFPGRIHGRGVRGEGMETARSELNISSRTGPNHHPRPSGARGRTAALPLSSRTARTEWRRRRRSATGSPLPESPPTPPTSSTSKTRKIPGGGGRGVFHHLSQEKREIGRVRKISFPSSSPAPPPSPTRADHQPSTKR